MLLVLAAAASGAASGAGAGVSVGSVTQLPPLQAVETWVRLKGDAAGAVTYEWVNGAAFGLPQDALATPLFRFESVTVRRFKPLGGPGQYLEISYSCRLYRDATSGAYIDRLVNPLTGREVKLTLGCNPGPTTRYSPQRVALEKDIGFRSSALDVPMRLERVDLGDRVLLRRDSRAEYTARATGELRRETSLDSFSVDAAALANRAITNLPAAYQWTSVTQWMADLGMGATPGRMLWSINGRKFDRVDALPAEFRAALEKALPGALARPLD